ncbi:MAG: glycosyltransferase family 2 protein [Proteobacteria bacterium]|nr:glycosyltransferase family 2 protein [Pseudomonadota bacterium]MBI3496040.1 glycosyltransferase family 2 protein [Pseudomonadota bacterium]
MTPAIIPFYRERQKLERCLSHLQRQTRPVRPVVIDNNVVNRYFTEAVNSGLRTVLASEATYALVLNQDMYLEPDAVERLTDFLDSTPRAGIAAPLHLSTAQPNHVDFAAGQDAFPLGFYLNGPPEAFTGDREVHWVSGACMLLRVDAIRDIGLFDSNMRFLGSDSDYCFTARARGWSVHVVGAARGAHDTGASNVEADQALELVKVQDILYFASKWLTGALYRHLAFEGERLTEARVREVVSHFERMRAGLAVTGGLTEGPTQAPL